MLNAETLSKSIYTMITGYQMVWFVIDVPKKFLMFQDALPKQTQKYWFYRFTCSISAIASDINK